MQFGVCGDMTIAAVAACKSYEFAEWSVPALLKPRESGAVFQASFDAICAAGLHYPVANCFVPADLKITGPEVDSSALQAYAATVMERAEMAGVEVVVFGSGGARRIPEGFDALRAHDQLVAFCRMVATMARDHSVTVVVEPLNKTECNVLNSVAECAALVREVAHPSIRLLVDAYHLMRENDLYEDIVRHGDLLAHVHIATVPQRLAPGAEPCDFSSFFGALADACYTGRVSIEGNIANPEAELPVALATMRKLSQVGGRKFE